MRLADKVAIITGASSGIGRSSAYLFAKEGAKLVVADIDNAGGEGVVSNIKTKGGEAIFVHTDITLASEIKALVRIVKNKFDKIDILFNNAGITAGDTLVEEIDESSWDRTYDVNVKGIFLATKYIVPEMKKAGGGIIINTASMAGIRPVARIADYASSKGAVITLTKALAIELAPYNIRVNCINPTITETPLVELMSEEWKKSIKSVLPLGRLAKPEDVAYAALYLASEESAMLTGMGINVDGGHGI